MSNDVFEVSIVKYGTRSTVKSDVYLNFHIYQMPDQPIEMDYFFWVIRNDATTVVVDTGFSEHGGGVRARTFVIEPRRAFEALGVDPDSAPPVIVTHAHYDHIGNLDIFDKSRITMSRKELEFWLSPFSERAQFKHSVESDELKTLAAAHAQGRIDVFDGTHTLMPGIELIEVGGHTPGTGDGEGRHRRRRSAAGVGRRALLRGVRGRHPVHVRQRSARHVPHVRPASTRWRPPARSSTWCPDTMRTP